MPESQFLAVVLSTTSTMIVVLIGILLNNARLGDVNHRIGELRSYVDTRFNEVDRRLNEMDRKADQRLDDVKATWRAELHRVEEVLDARLKHLEER